MRPGCRSPTASSPPWRWCGCPPTGATSRPDWGWAPGVSGRAGGPGSPGGSRASPGRAARRGGTAAGPDVCGLQGVWAGPAENRGGWLADEVGMHWAWGPTRHPERWQRRVDDPAAQFGTAILSRWPIADPRVEELPGDEGRVVLGAMIEAPHGRVPFFSAHLSAMARRSAIRRTQGQPLCRPGAPRPAPAPPPGPVWGFQAPPGAG